jgi:hypothetical protein
MVLMLAFGGRGIEGDAVEDLSIADALFDLPHEIVMGAENPASCIVGKDSQVEIAERGLLGDSDWFEEQLVVRDERDRIQICGLIQANDVADGVIGGDAIDGGMRLSEQSRDFDDAVEDSMLIISSN